MILTLKRLALTLKCMVLTKEYVFNKKVWFKQKSMVLTKHTADLDACYMSKV
jgi:hypothetical protein